MIHASPFPDRQPTIHHLSDDLKWFEPTLLDWAELLQTWSGAARRSLRPDENLDGALPDAAQWHGERALVGMLSSAAWRQRVPNLVEVNSDSVGQDGSKFLDMYVMAEDEHHHLFFEAKKVWPIVEARSPLLGTRATNELAEAERQLRRWSTEVEHIAEVRAANPHQRFRLLALLFVAPQLRDPAAASSLHWPSSELPGRPEFAGWRVAMEAWAPTSVRSRWPYDPERETHWPGVFLLALERADL